MKIGHIYIVGLIGSFKDENGVQLIDVISQVQKCRDAEELYVYVSGPGGSIEEGDNIYSYLKSLRQKVTTISFGMVASIATKVSLAGDERIMINRTDSEFMIHNPWVSGVDGDADHLMTIAEDIKREEDRLIDFYASLTGISKEGLDALMKAETYMTPAQALEFGFVTKIMTEEEAKTDGIILTVETASKFKALAFNKKQIEKSMTKVLESKVDKMLDFLAKLVPGKKGDKVALSVTDSNGTTLEITNEDGTDVTDPAEGNLVTVDGNPAEGTYTIPDKGIVITVAAGVITSVETVADPGDDSEDLAKANNRIKELETELAERKKSEKAMEAKFGKLETALKAISSDYQPVGREQQFTKGKPQEQKENRVLLAQERKKQYKQKSK
jgi:ATP-dependent Clp endopeptidase proteolytic subunit ClpP